MSTYKSELPPVKEQEEQQEVHGKEDKQSPEYFV
jgi:hypothetical protein